MLLLSDSDSSVPPVMHFIIGGVSGATGQTATHPCDVLKVQMQISKSSVRETLQNSLKHAGIRGLYIGWTASVLRQITYSTSRLGIYSSLSDLAKKQFGRLNYPTLIGIGMFSGIVGAFVGTPADLVLIRMIADIKLPPEQRRNYRNAIAGLVDICRTEGIRGMWRGAVPTMTRAAVVNGSQLGTYSRSKMFLLDSGHFKDGVVLQFIAAMLSGLAMSIASLPIDVAKTRIQNWSLPSKPPGIAYMLINIVRNDGILSLWTGFLPYFSRAAPYATVTMICVDQLTRIYTELFRTPKQ